MEAILEILLGFVQIAGEMILQMAFELLAEAGIRRLGEPFRKPEPANPVSASIGYALLGSIAGAISLLFFSHSFIGPDWLKIVHLGAMPLFAGGMMSFLGAWRKRRGHELIRLDEFGYGFLFALAMGTVRFVWAR